MCSISCVGAAGFSCSPCLPRAARGASKSAHVTLAASKLTHRIFVIGMVVLHAAFLGDPRRTTSIISLPDALRLWPIPNFAPMYYLSLNQLECRRMASYRRFSIAILVLFVCAIFFQAWLHAQKPSPDELLVLNDVTVVDVRTGTLQSGQTVILEHNRIASVGPGKSAKYPRNAASVNCRGLFLIPGLWDMHVHLVFGDWFPDAQDISLPLFVASGITGVRDMGSELDIVQGWRNEIEAGRLVGPRIYTSGPMLDGPKPRFPSSLAIATPEDAHRAVADLKQRGADFIKLQSLIPREAVFAIAEEAKKQEIPFEGHVPDAVRASEMSAAGMKSFEHLIGIFEGSSPAEGEFLKGNKTERKFLTTYDAARAAALAEILAKK